jgi:large repetitive protein
VTQDGQILLSSTDIPVGTHALTVQYSGDNSFNPSTSAPITVTIPKGQSVTYPNPVGGPDSLTFAGLSVSGTTLPTGTMQLWDNGVAMSPPQTVVYNGIGGAGFAQINTQHTYTPGQHIIQATYSGDSNYDPVAFNSDFAYQRTLNFGPSNGTAATIVSFTMTNAPTLSQGSIATFNFSVVAKTPNGTLPTGQINIYDGNNEIAGAFIVNGKGSAISYMDYAGDFNLRAEYEGDTNFASSLSANTIKLSVPKLTPAITFTTSGASALPNSQVSLNFTAAGQKINPFVEQDPTGTVTYSDSVNGGAAQVLGVFQVGFLNGLVGGYSGRFTLPTGTNVITAAYSGNPNFISASATSIVVVGDPGFTISSTQSSLVVNAGAPSSVDLALSPTLGFTGTAALSCASGVPAGSTCAFSSSSLTFGGAQTSTLTVTVPAASPTTVGRVAEPKSLTVMAGAAFAGVLLLCVPRRRKMASLLALLLAVTVPFIGCGGSSQPKATLLSVSSSSIKVASGSAVTLTANLNALEGSPTGTVTFYDGKTAIGAAVALSGNVATLQTTTLSIGAHSITAVYSGDSKNDPSTSTAITEVLTGTTTLQVSATAGSIVQTLSIPLTLQ